MIRKFFSTEAAKLKEMNFTDKRQYIWEYYKLHILFIGLGVIILGSLINIWFINPPQRDYLYIAWQAGPVHSGRLDEMGDKLSVIVYDQDRYRVSVRSYVLGDDPQINQAIVTRFHALLSVGDIHGIITTREGIQESADFGMIRSTAEVMDVLRESKPALYDKMTERLLTVTYSEGEDEPEITDIMAIDISGAPLLEEIGFVMDDLYLGVIINSSRFDEIARALAVMFDY